MNKHAILNFQQPPLFKKNLNLRFLKFLIIKDNEHMHATSMNIGSYVMELKVDKWHHELAN